MRASSLLVALVVALASLLAGCSEAPRAPAELVIESAPPEEIRSGEGALGASPLTETYEKSASVKGHIAGVVVDEAIRPIHGAKVRLPGMNMERPTERDGSFGFVDLYPGPYYLTVELDGYYMAEAMLEVKSEEFTRAKVVLAAIPPPDPYHATQSFDGFADATSDPFLGGGLLCRDCDFDFYIDRAGLHTVILEAVGNPYVEGDGFWHDFYRYGDGSYNGQVSSDSTTGPLRIELRDADLGDDEDRFHLRIYPVSSPAPQMNKAFQVFVTAFYNEGPPTGWSIVNGDS